MPFAQVVPETGLEPARAYSPLDFLTTLCHHSRPYGRCSLDSVFTIPAAAGLGGWCIVSTHYVFLHIGTAFSVRFRRLASFYSKGFPLGTLYESIVVHFEVENRLKSKASAIPPLRHIVFSFFLHIYYIIFF